MKLDETTKKQITDKVKTGGKLTPNERNAFRIASLMETIVHEEKVLKNDIDFAKSMMRYATKQKEKVEKLYKQLQELKEGEKQ